MDYCEQGLHFAVCLAVTLRYSFSIYREEYVKSCTEQTAHAF